MHAAVRLRTHCAPGVVTLHSLFSPNGHSLFRRHVCSPLTFLISRHHLSRSYSSSCLRALRHTRRYCSSVRRRTFGTLLTEVDKPSARALLPLLNEQCPLGWGKRSQLVDEVIQWKKQHQDKVLLVRVGEFYEAYGVDAVMLVQWCGLNPMARKPRAGCPRANIQQTCDALTFYGLSVAIYEEVSDHGASRGERGGKRMKQRVFSQIVSPAAPTYLKSDSNKEVDSANEARPVIGIRRHLDANTFDICELHVEEGQVRCLEYFTAEACRAWLSRLPNGPAMVLIAGSKAGLEFIEGDQVKTLKVPTCYEEFISMCLQESDMPMNTHRVRMSTASGLSPLGMGVARLLGLDTGKGPYTQRPLTVAPPLVSSLVPRNAPAYTHRFWQQWLLAPPPTEVAEAMQRLVVQLQTHDQALPNAVMRPISIRKLILMQQGKSEPTLFFDVRAMCQAFVDTQWPNLVAPLGIACAHQSGLRNENYAPTALEIITLIDDALEDEFCDIEDEGLDNCASWASFVERNETFRRYRLKMEFPKLDRARTDLMGAIEKHGGSVGYDVNQNVLFVMKTNKKGKGPKASELISLPKKRQTTKALNEHVRAYVSLAVDAREQAERRIEALALAISERMKCLVWTTHWMTILSAAHMHAEEALRRNWCVPASGTTLAIKDVSPYWLEFEGCVFNSITLSGDSTVVLLAAPNAAGKSSLLRALLAVTLLKHCGLMVPATSATVPSFDHLLAFSPQGDRPMEHLSAFEAETAEVANIVRTMTPKSLVVIDEFARGTSAREGAALAGALIEKLRGCALSIFSTHLHEIYHLPLQFTPSYWTMVKYHVRDGICLSSEALTCAAKAKFPEDLLARAAELLNLSLPVSAQQTPWSTQDQPASDDVIVDRSPMLDGHLANTSISMTDDKRNLKTALRATFKDKDRVMTDSCTEGHFASIPFTPTVNDQSPLLEHRSMEAGEVGGILTNENTEACFTDTVKGVLRDISNTKRVSTVKRDAHPAPRLAAKAVIYALRTERGWYIGQTEALRQRLEQHRQAYQWDVAFIAGVTDRNTARVRESQIISRLRLQHVPLLSTADVAQSAVNLFRCNSDGNETR